MEGVIIEVLEKLGISGGTGVILYFILKGKIQSLEDSLEKHISGHIDMEKNLYAKIEKIYERLNPIGENVSKIQGILEAQQMIKENSQQGRKN